MNAELVKERLETLGKPCSAIRANDANLEAERG